MTLNVIVTPAPAAPEAPLPEYGVALIEWFPTAGVHGLKSPAVSPARE
jgi:hypothetical protein